MKIIPPGPTFSIPVWSLPVISLLCRRANEMSQQVRKNAMYLRFVVTEKDWESGREMGIFHAFRYLRDDGKLYSYEEELHEDIRLWFDYNLSRPTRFTASKPPFYRKPRKAICWFKDTACEHLSWAWWMVAILENHQIPVKLLKATRVGYVVYEDGFQIVAEPYADLR
jgi:hypothetical protein